MAQTTKGTNIEKITESSAALALTLPDDLSIEEWVAVGEKLTLAGERLQWWVGDWWAYGDRHYGDGAIKALPASYSLHTVQNMGTVSRSFTDGDRRADLTWTHHRAVLALEAAERSVLLDRAATEGLTVRGLTRLVDQYRAAMTESTPTSNLPPGGKIDQSSLHSTPDPIPATSTDTTPDAEHYLISDEGDMMVCACGLRPCPVLSPHLNELGEDDRAIGEPTGATSEPTAATTAADRLDAAFDDEDDDDATVGDDDLVESVVHLQAENDRLRDDLEKARQRIANQTLLLERAEGVPVWDRLLNEHSPAALAKTPDGRRIRDGLRGFVAAMSASLDGPGPGVRRPNPGMAKPPKAERTEKTDKTKAYADGPTEDPMTCSHPKDAENVQNYGVFCAACGKRVR